MDKTGMANSGVPIGTWAPEGSETQQLGRHTKGNKEKGNRERTCRLMGLNSWAGGGLKVAY